MSRKYFGTDGVRGLVGQYPITPEFALKLGWAAGRAMAVKVDNPSVVVGKDTRLSGYLFESALEAGLSAAGVSVRLLGPIPTPAVAHLTRAFHASAGIVISASHNPYHDNGIKFFGPDGRKLDDAVELSIESWLDQDMRIDNPDTLGKVTRQEDARGRYIEFCKSTFPYHLSLRGLTIVIDGAHGATYHVGPAVFDELGARVIRHACEPNGHNINDGVGSTHPESLQQRVLAEKADLGIAFDGDGDRIVMVDHRGEVVDGDELLYVMARERQRSGASIGGVVGTLMSNFGLEKAIQAMGVEFVRANVGDRYVMAALNERGWTLGGEASGHIVCLDKSSTGDAIVAALQVLKAIVESGKPLAELKAGMSKFPHELINVRLAERVDVMSKPSVQLAIADAEQQLAGQGRVLLRASGTEPVIRVMVEGQNAALVQALAKSLAETVRNCL
ncbi:phosphoglucosamine mutase [Paraperlucidibaca baekdonensis]|uniref:Phosphoglucosamine mutase n=1 Tax=Paraperlucidibaca baekdonensis TaxID=748120 RepID=A0A3E0H7Y2_9GAMM|nr:phosphoglucosamine mutase [Paraperlucidibaca baekdonensis]REH39845.1 phosphoglucosamine mutase [Paraperlucidibaca baekdonensis]